MHRTSSHPVHAFSSFSSVLLSMLLSRSNTYSKTILINWAAFHLAEKDNLCDVEITKANKWAPKCPNCGRKMTFVCYEKGPPTKNFVFCCKLADWNHPMLSPSYN